MFSATAEKEEDQCDLPGCQVPKRREGAHIHDYCCRAHAQQDAPNRDGVSSYITLTYLPCFLVQLAF